MGPITAVISRVQRDLALSTALKLVLAVAAFLGVVLGPIMGVDGALPLLLAAGVWLLLSFRSVRGSRIAAVSPSLIATGQFDRAEEQIGRALRSFSLFRTSKLLSLHHLALLRHAQRRWQETAEVCRALLRQRLGGLHGLSRSSRLMLADALMEMGDLAAAHETLRVLYGQRLSLGEALTLLRIQLAYETRIGAWAHAAENLPVKTQLAELMPAEQSALTQAMLALAAQRKGREDWADWLRRRAELLADVQKMITVQPALRGLWAERNDKE